MNYRLKPFIRWAGGKQHQSEWISNQIPFNKINRYYEPFLGAGSIFLYNDLNDAYLSDVNQQLINTYISVREDPFQLNSYLDKYSKNISEEFYYKIREDYNNHLLEYSIEQSARFIFLIQTSFNGIYRVNKEGFYNVPFGKMKPALPNLDTLVSISRKLENCTLTTGSYETILNLINQRDFVYLDPPYPPLNGSSNFQHYTADRFPNSEQLKLARFANKLTDKNVLVAISNADLEIIRSLYTGWNITSNNVIRYISCKTLKHKVKEILIKNY